MPLGVVAIEFPDQTPRAWVEATTSACQAALGADRCVEARESVVVAWRAEVVLSDDPATPVLRIELFEVEGDALESARLLRFQDIDPERQRWASAGVVIAAMVSAGEAGRDSEAESLARPPFAAIEYPTARTRDPSPSRREHHFWIDVAALVQNSLVSEPPAIGGGLAAQARPFRGPLLLRASATLSWATDPIDSRRLALGAGGGVRLLDSRVLWDATIEWRFQHHSVVAHRTQEGSTESDSFAEWRHGPVLGTAVGVELFDPLGVFFGAEMGRYLRSYDVKVEDQLVGRVPAFDFGILAGIRWIAPW
jgi:hypothetical protein